MRACRVVRARTRYACDAFASPASDAPSRARRLCRADARSSGEGATKRERVGRSGRGHRGCTRRCLPRAGVLGSLTRPAVRGVGGGFRSRELLPGQTAADRPDLVARVFKLDALLTDLWATVFSDTCGREFTRCVYLSITCDIVRHARVLTRYEPHVEQVEWQKRGLPHAHILLIHPDRFDEYGDMAQTSTDRFLVRDSIQ